MPRAARARLGLLVALGLAAAAPAASAAEPVFPKLTGRVVDGAQLLSREAEARIDRALAAHERATGNQIVVVTLESLQGLPIEDYGYRLGRHWGIGRAEHDDGALLIVAPSERKVRIEVGYGLEGTLTDALSAHVIQTVTLPHFKRGDFEGGIEATASAMLAVLGGEYAPQDAPGDASLDWGWQGDVVIFLLIFAFVVVVGLHSQTPAGRRRARRQRIHLTPTGSFGGSGGGFGGGFGGGGGGFGGGGASGSW